MATSCEFEFMEYIDEDSIDPNLICSICHKPFKDPVCTPCDHSYGRACISHWLTSSLHYSCPTCQKQPLLITELTQASRPLRNMLDQFRVRCTLCEQTGLQRGNFVDHINKFCPKTMVQCQAADIKCPWKGPREELHDHVSGCIFEPLRPVLSVLITENRQLIDQVQQHDKQIKELTNKISQLNNTVAHNSDDESDASSVSEVAGANNQKEEDAIFIRNLPSNIRFNDLFDLFSTVGRIKYNASTQQSNIFIFKNPNNKGGSCTAKVVFANKEMAAAAVAEYNNKQIPQWNTRLLVSISNPKRKNMKGFGKGNNENVGGHHEGRATGGGEKTSNQNETTSGLTDHPEIPIEQDSATRNKKTRRRQQNSRSRDKPTN